MQQIGTGALPIVNNFVLGLILGNDSIYLFDSHSKDENRNLLSPGTAVLLQFEKLLLLENCNTISLLQCLSTDSVLSYAIYKSSLYCQ